MITIAWDIDDVLNELMRFWFKEWLILHPQCILKYEQISENPPHRLLGVSKEDYSNSLDEFRLSGRYRAMQPNLEIKKWFLRYGKFFRHIALSAVPQREAPVSAEWAFAHFGIWIRTFHFVPSLRKGEKLPLYDKSKKDFLKWMGKVDIFIDDTEANLSACEELGIKVVLFPQPWNKSKLSIAETLEKLRYSEK